MPYIELLNTPYYTDANLLLYYRLEGNSNASVGAANGTDTSIDYSVSYGYVNQGARFNASTDLIALGTSDTYNLTGNMTIMCWVYPLDIGPDFSRFTFDRGVGTGGVGFEVWMQSAANREIVLAINTGSVTSSTGALTFNAWNHVVITRTTSAIVIYVNGVSVGTGGANTITSASGQAMNIGQQSGATTRAFNGYTDEQALFNRALSAAEVTQIYNGEYPSSGGSFLLNFV